MQFNSERDTVDGKFRSDLVCSQMVNDLIEGIASSRIKPGDRIPPERTLKVQYGISVTSVRRGMDLLVRQGLLVRRQGSGTFVRNQPVQSQLTRPDTIMLCESAIHPPTHPYFGPLNRGLQTHLIELGWKVRAMLKSYPDGNGAKMGRLTVNGNALVNACKNAGNIAGVVLHGPMDVAPHELLDHGFPCVALGERDDCPFVAYNWRDEIMRALIVALRNGARRIWLASSMTDKTVKDLTRCATAIACPDETVQVRCVAIPGSQTYGVVTNNAYVQTKHTLASERRLPDAIVVGSDFETQGVIDALTEAGMQADTCPALVALVSTESRIHSVLPYTALVSDGYAAGVALADLLHQHITAPSTAPGSIFLNCSLRTPPR